MSNRLDIITLGGLLIEIDGEPIAGLASRKAMALLVYLARTEKSHSRQALATMFWDDRPDQRALSNLSVVLTSLRKQLSTHLKITSQSVGLKKDAGWRLDCQELEAGLANAGDNITTEVTERLEAALSLYQGDFLLGFHLRNSRDFEEWALLERERLNRRTLESYSRLAEYYVRHGDPVAGIPFARRIVEIDPLREDAHRLLMSMLAKAGQRGSALAQYALCKEAMDVELGVEPSQETNELYSRIKQAAKGIPGNLPSQVSTFIGRRAELAAVRERLLDPKCRLLTLVGPGGIGKTRLAIETAHEMGTTFLEGIWLVDFASIEDAALVQQEIAARIGILEGFAELPSEAEGSFLSRLIDLLISKEMLILLDNCEHVLQECARVSEALLRGCPHLKILATSREKLNLDGEVLWEVPGMALPDPEGIPVESGRSAEQSDAVQLLIERASAVRRDFSPSAELIASICHSLDGMPLAIELVASRMRLYSLEDIEQHLDDLFGLLRAEIKGKLPRHQTLRATIEWSYDLLDAEERWLFDGLAIFRGGFYMDAAIEICSGDGVSGTEIPDVLGRLVDKSLVQARHHGGRPARFRLLETVRQFGMQNLKSREDFQELQSSHAANYLEVVEAAAVHLHGPDQLEWFRRLEPDLDNVRAALRWSLQTGDAGSSVRIAAALWEPVWFTRAYFKEGKDWLDQITQQFGKVDTALGLNIALGRGALSWALGEVQAALEQFESTLKRAEDSGDAYTQSWCKYWLGFHWYEQGDLSKAEASSKAGLRLVEHSGQTRLSAWHSFTLAHIARARGEFERAKLIYADARSVFEEEELFGAGVSDIFIGLIAAHEHDYPAAQSKIAEAMKLFEKIGNLRGKAVALRSLGVVAMGEGDYDRARGHLDECMVILDQIAWKSILAGAMAYTAVVAKLEGKAEEAANGMIEGLQLLRTTGDQHWRVFLFAAMGGLAVSLGQLEIGAKLHGRAHALRDSSGIVFPSYEDKILHAELDDLRQQFDAKTFEALRAEGSRMSNEEVMELALKIASG